MKKSIVVGFDFDGVVAYNPARLARLPISYIKRHVFGITNTSFFVPKTPLQRSLWALGHETSMFPAKGASLLRTLTQNGTIEAHLVTARFGFLEHHLLQFLDRWNLRSCFTSITLNTKEEQAHIYKERIVSSQKFDFYVEDNWDIVSFLHKKSVHTSVHWIYNILDRKRAYKDKYPYLERSLDRIAALHKKRR